MSYHVNRKNKLTN